MCITPPLNVVPKPTKTKQNKTQFIPVPVTFAKNYNSVENQWTHGRRRDFSLFLPVRRCAIITASSFKCDNAASARLDRMTNRNGIEGE